MDRLTVVPPYGKSFYYPVRRRSIVIGRSKTVDLPITDRFLSREHARLFQDHGTWWIEDLHSRNGSWLNGKRIDHPAPVHDGDRIRLSNSYILSGPEPDDFEKTPTDFITAGSSATFRPVAEITTGQSSRLPTNLASPEAFHAHTDDLRLLNQIQSSLSRAVDLEGLMHQILDRSFEALGPDQGVIFLRQASGEFHLAAERARGPMANEPLRSETLLKKVAEEGLTALVQGLDRDPDWQSADSMLEQGIKSLIAAPLKDADGPLGMIALTSKHADSPFGDPELQLLVSIAAIASLRVRNLLLTEDAVRRNLAQDQLDQELELARKIQLGLLPSGIPEIEGFDIYGSSIPSRRVSGDYYQVISRKDGQEALVVLADVAGKGLGASLLMASLEALAIGPIEVGHPPAEICRRISRRLFERTISSRFATMFVAAFNIGNGSFSYANAGHCPALLIRAEGKVTRLKATGPPLGLFLNKTYTQSRHRLHAGDLLFLYSDGFSEASTPDDNEYGIRRMTRLCKAHRELPLPELASRLEKDIESFVQGHPYEDDRTLLVVRRTQ
jgi:sigma-B regulation protein RsbU (phosphoserine phosphatase)